jgi:Cytochrome bd terminal oxidase subunit I
LPFECNIYGEFDWMSNYAKRAGWTYIGFAKAADLLVVHLTSWRASRPAGVERANQRVVLSDKGVVSGIIMPFQFGTNWSRFTDATADVLSPMTQ